MAVVRRLPRYYRYLEDMLARGVTRASSAELSRSMNATASQIRQDLSNFGSFGQQGYGYNVEMLRDEIKKILGLDKEYRLILIGAGALGQALVRYEKFEKKGFRFTGLFDNDPNRIGTFIRDIEVWDVQRLQSFLSGNPVDIAVFTLPRDGAEKALDIVTGAGVKGIWNFSYRDLRISGGTKVESVHLTDSLMTLSYMLSEGNK